jgi:hypothetical protein
MAEDGSEKGQPGSLQNEKAPQDETPGGQRQKARKQTDIGVVKRKPKTVAGAHKSSDNSGNADIGDETAK